jgi:peptidoglycan-N-acetylglucosamine deacetylase
MQALWPGSLWQADPDGHKVYLTFDDGPDPSITPFVLECLAKHHAKATFFLLGKQAEQHPSLVRELKSANHSIGNHTWAHSDGWRVSRTAYLADVKKGNEAIANITGSVPRLFRPPYGRAPLGISRQLNGQQLTYWSLNPRDYDPLCPISRSVETARTGIKAGHIVLLHDNARTAERQRVLLPILLDTLALQGFTFASL